MAHGTAKSYDLTSCFDVRHCRFNAIYSRRYFIREELITSYLTAKRTVTEKCCNMLSLVIMSGSLNSKSESDDLE